MKYFCKRCGHMTKQKNDMRKHYNRTKQCSPLLKDIPIDTLIKELDDKDIENAQECSKTAQKLLKKLQNKEFCNISENINPLECRYCTKIYSKTSNLKRHLETCKEKLKKEKLKQEETDLMKQIMAQKDAEIAQKDEENQLYKEEMALMRKQIELLMTKIGNTNIETQNNNNTTNNITNIQINGWGEEDRSHLTDKFYRFCYDRPFTSIQRVIEAVFFNPNCPKNWNVMIKDDKSSKALVYNREKDAWLKKETNGVLEDLMHIGYSMLDENFDKQRDANKLTDRLIEKFTNFQDIYAKGDKQYEKRLATEIKELLINYKAYHVVE